MDAHAVAVRCHFVCHKAGDSPDADAAKLVFVRLPWLLLQPLEALVHLACQDLVRVYADEHGLAPFSSILRRSLNHTRESMRTMPREPSTVRSMPSLMTDVPTTVWTTQGRRYSRA